MLLHVHAVEKAAHAHTAASAQALRLTAGLCGTMSVAAAVAAAAAAAAAAEALLPLAFART